MLARLIVLLVVLGAVLWAVRWFTRTPPQQVARVLRRGLLWGAIGILVLAAATGRLNPLFALLAAAVPLVLRGLALLRLVPVVQQVLRGLGITGASGTAAGVDAGAGRGDRGSSLRTQFFEMHLDHATGQMDGLVRKGGLRGRRLSALTIEQLIDLLDECRAADAQSATVLESYLDREHGEDWRARAQGRGERAAGPDFGQLSRQEACEILGVKATAGPDEIRTAHRRLMQKYHPDRGGSDYLAAKINAAKRRLLED
ncbi:DnaJ-class molecular chaperone with C-terminal Zn finger domain [Thioflavicoccus mobilis 8321]|uniref:DnaJ-class molecular chaperone with C-terminal Zn finger domain n=1 Tax=Thioflavicoccus mobilis 8321 TaxID=765912 RepID=L0GWZ0_9GAMM|nr:DnaJ domain-containing protein [Thioflavicoccus mobilis]AGA91283.1 DnaJ-class molecular chaperone with C-terminal Zn finger domain [Thioflavicoccus mobilis 8321]